MNNYIIQIFSPYSMNYLLFVINKNTIVKLKRVWRYQREVIRIRKSKKNRHHNGRKKKYKRTNNDLQNMHIKLQIE